jgi:ATP-dependent Zn protease
MLFDEIMPRGTAEADTYEARLRAKCQGIVRRHRKTIARVAEALLAEGTLTAVEIDTMIETQAALSGGGVEP